MTLVSELITQVSAHLHSFTGFTEATTYLTTGVTSSDLALPVAHPTRMTQGLIEVDDELVQVDTVGDTSVSAFPGFGRGARQTTAAAHSMNAMVLNDPQFPRVRIFDALKRCIHQIQPDLFQVKVAALFPASAVATTYEIPADVTHILKVQWQSLGPSQEWINVRRWTVDQDAATVTGKSLVVHESMQPGRNVQVVYAAPFVSPTAVTDDLESVCKIPTSIHDVLLYGASYSIIQFLEPYRLQLRSVEQQARAQGVDVGSASKVAQQMYAMYDLRKREERAKLLNLHPVAMHQAVR